MRTVHILQIKILKVCDQCPLSLREHLPGKTNDDYKVALRVSGQNKGHLTFAFSQVKAKTDEINIPSRAYFS